MGGSTIKDMLASVTSPWCNQPIKFATIANTVYKTTLQCYI